MNFSLKNHPRKFFPFLSSNFPLFKSSPKKSPAQKHFFSSKASPCDVAANPNGESNPNGENPHKMERESVEIGEIFVKDEISRLYSSKKYQFEPISYKIPEDFLESELCPTFFQELKLSISPFFSGKKFSTEENSYFRKRIISILSPHQNSELFCDKIALKISQELNASFFLLDWWHFLVPSEKSFSRLKFPPSLDPSIKKTPLAFSTAIHAKEEIKASCISLNFFQQFSEHLSKISQTSSSAHIFYIRNFQSLSHHAEFQKSFLSLVEFCENQQLSVVFLTAFSFSPADFLPFPWIPASFFQLSSGAQPQSFSFDFRPDSKKIQISSISSASSPEMKKILPRLKIIPLKRSDSLSAEQWETLLKKDVSKIRLLRNHQLMSFFFNLHQMKIIESGENFQPFSEKFNTFFASIHFPPNFLSNFIYSLSCHSFVHFSSSTNFHGDFIEEFFQNHFNFWNQPICVGKIPPLHLSKSNHEHSLLFKPLYSKKTLDSIRNEFVGAHQGQIVDVVDEEEEDEEEEKDAGNSCDEDEDSEDEDFLENEEFSHIFGDANSSSPRSAAKHRSYKLMKNRILKPGSLNVDFDQIACQESIKQALHDVITLPILCPNFFASGVLRNSCTGVLLFGPPGTGKTMLAKAVANSSGSNFLPVSASDLMQMFVGESEKFVKSIFMVAREHRPCVIFVDEAESFLSGRGASESGDHRRGVLAEFISEWDGLQSENAGVLVMGASNRPFDLDSAVIRRFPRRFMVDLPDFAARKQIFHLLLRHDQVANDCDFAWLATKTHNYTGSDLKNICVNAALYAAREVIALGGKSGFEIRKHHFEKALSNVSSSVYDDLTSVQQIRKWNRQYGEGADRSTLQKLGFS